MNLWQALVSFAVDAIAVRKSTQTPGQNYRKKRNRVSHQLIIKIQLDIVRTDLLTYPKFIETVL